MKTPSSAVPRKAMRALASVVAALICVVGPAGAAEVLTTSSPASPNLIKNGGFEQPSGVGTYTVFSAGRQLPGWKIESGTVEVVGPYWKAAEGSQSLDLNGIFEQIGTIYQDVPTTPNQRYRIRFAFAGNPEGGPVIKTIRISWGAEDLGTLSFDTTGCNFTNMNYTQHQYLVTATSGTSRLRFQSLTPTFCGPVLDDISVCAESGSAPTLADRVEAVMRESHGGRSSPGPVPAGTPATLTTSAASTMAPTEASPAVLQLHLRPVLTIFGIVGRTYLIESATDLSQPEWIARTNLVLETSPFLWIDTELPNSSNRFYRAVLAE